MRTLLRRKKAPQDEGPGLAAQDRTESEAQEDNRLLLLIPEGAYTYRLVAFPDVKSAAEYVDRHLLAGQSFLSFWALDAPDGTAPSQPGEALILVRDEMRPEIVRPYSFTDMSAARSFLQSETGAGLEAEGVLFFWAEPVSVPRGLTISPAGAPAAVGRQEPAAPQPVGAPAHARPASTAQARPEPRPAVEDPLGAPVTEARPPGITSRIINWPGWDGLAPHMVSAALAKRRVYQEAVESDPYAGGRARLILLLGALSAAIGGLGAGAFAPLWYFAGALCGWWVYTGIIYVTALILIPGKRPQNLYRRLLVSLGLAYSPAIFLVLGLLPVYGPLFTLGVLIWLGVTGVAAVGVALEMERETVWLTTFAGWIFLFAVTLIAPQLVA